MNATDRLTPDLQFSRPVDGLEMIIESLDHVIPVFNERRLDLGVNTGYCRAFVGFLSSRAQIIASTTQNTRRKEIIPAAPILSRLKEATRKAAGEIDSLRQQEWASDNVNANGRRFLVGVSQGHIGELLNAITRLESNWGSFDIWIKQPCRAAYKSLNRAWQEGERDSPEFFEWFRERILGLPSSELDAYIGQVLIGVHVAGGELRLAGDIHEGPKRQNLAEKSDKEIRTAILQRARTLKYRDEIGSTHLIPVYPAWRDEERRPSVRRYGTSDVSRSPSENSNIGCGFTWRGETE